MSALVVPEKIFEQHTIALGKTGAGKSSAVRVLVEHLLNKKQRCIVITPKADWWGLKLAGDGEHPGYPVPVFGGEHADMPLNHASGKTIAELLGTGDRSAILQMREFMPGERTTFWIDFAATLFRVLRGKLYLVIDEVHNFAPKGKVLDAKAGMMLHWSNKLASEARGLGITLIAASQRPAKVHNDFLTSCETLIAMRVTTKWDRDAVKEWIAGCGDSGAANEVLNTLAQMKRGDAWAWSPEIEFGPERVHFPMFKTYDSFRPQTAQDAKTLKGWADVDLDEVKKKLEHVVKEAEANDPVKLKARIRELEAEARKKHPAAKSAAPDQRTIERTVAQAVKQNAAQFEKNFASLQSVIKRQAKTLSDIAMVAAKAANIEPPKIAPPKIEFTAGAPAAAHSDVAPPVIYRTPEVKCGDVTLKKGAVRMLQILAQWHPEPRTRDQLGVLAGFSPNGGTFQEYLSVLRRAAFIAENGNGIHITDEGIAAAGDVRARPNSSEELLAMWKTKFKAGAARMLEILAHSHPHEITRDALGEASGFESSGGTFQEYLSSLRRAGLVTVNGANLRASDSLFP